MAKPETLRRILNEHNINADIVNKINSGFENVTDKSPKKKKAQYLFHAVNVLDNTLDIKTRQKVMEACACSIGTSIDKAVVQFAKKAQHLSIEEKVRKLVEIKHLGNPVLQADGTIIVGTYVEIDGVYKCPCPQISGVENQCAEVFYILHVLRRTL